MNHKRGRPKSKRAGCLLCKPHKHEAHAKAPRSKRAIVVLSDDLGELVQESAELELDLLMIDVDYEDCDWGYLEEHESATPLRAALLANPLRGWLSPPRAA